MEISPLRQLRTGKLPKMVSWYDPRLLARIGVRTIISNVFGQYADQRLIQAVTDPAADDEAVGRGRSFDGPAQHAARLLCARGHVFLPPRSPENVHQPSKDTAYTGKLERTPLNFASPA